MTNEEIERAIRALEQWRRDMSAIQPYAGLTRVGNSMKVQGDLTVTGDIPGFPTDADLAAHAAHLVDQYMYGFVTRYDGQQETTISFDGTNTFTLAPTGTTWSYYRTGVKCTVTGSKTCTLSATPPAAKGFYFIYIDATDGTLTCSTTGWTLEDTKVPVATICWDNALTPKYWLADERHTCAIDRRYHWEHHFADGTEVITTGTLAGYTVTPTSPANTDNTFSISASLIADEDLKITLAALSDGDGTNPNYIIHYRTAAAVWAWEKSIVPFRYTAAGYIQYDNAGTMTEGAANKFYNTYLLLTNTLGDARFSFISGQGEYNTLALAQAESFSNLTRTGINIAEYVAVYQITWGTGASYSTLGKCRLAAAPKQIAISVTGTGTPVSLEHNTLTGLQGGTAGEYYHTTAAQNTNLHVPVTVSDTATVDLSLTGQALTAAVIPGGIKLDDLGTPDDNTDLNASTARHGLLPKLGAVVTDLNADKLDGYHAGESGGNSTIPATNSSGNLSIGTGSITGSTAVWARVYRSTNKSITNNTQTPVDFDAERFDTASMHDNSTNNTRLTCTVAGTYMIMGNVTWATGTTGDRLMYFRINGSTIIGAVQDKPNGVLLQTLSSAYTLAVNDYVELMVFSNGGDTTLTSAAQYSPEFMMARIA